MREYMTYEELAYMGVIPTNNELYHHGILGMRWGRKNGPPYPLPNSRHSSSEKRAGWKDSLTSVAKATGRGVAALAKGTARAVKGTVGGVNKASIRLGLKPKKMMTNEELDAEIERIRKEDILKHLRGKKTDSDRLAIKLDKKSKRREMMKNVVQETLKTIGTKVIGEGLATDLKNRLNLASNKRADKYAVERAELYPDFDFGKEKGKKKDKGNTQPSDNTNTANATESKPKKESTTKIQNESTSPKTENKQASSDTTATPKKVATSSDDFSSNYKEGLEAYKKGKESEVKDFSSYYSKNSYDGHSGKSVDRSSAFLDDSKVQWYNPSSDGKSITDAKMKRIAKTTIKEAEEVAEKIEKKYDWSTFMWTGEKERKR